MKNTGRVSDKFRGIEDIFNPYIAFEGNYVIPYDLFVSNGRTKSGVNLAQQFFDKHYFNKVREIFSKMRIAADPNLFLVSDMNPDGYGRSLKPSLSLLVMDFCHELTGTTFTASEDYTELIQQVKDFSRSYRRDLAAISRGEMNEERERILRELRESYEHNERIRSSIYGKAYYPMSFEDFVEKKKEYMISLSFGLPSLVPIFEKSIDLSELAECLDLEKFYLAIMKLLIETTLTTIALTDHVHNSLVLVATYVNIVKEIRKNGHYEMTITYTTPDGKKLRYSIDDLIREYNEIRLKNPDFELIEVEGPAEDLRDINKAREFQTRIEDIMAAKELQASWNFIRNGSREDTIQTTRINLTARERLSSSGKGKRRKSREELIASTNDRIAFLDSTPYLYKMNGKNNFDGYVGYIYENGSVIFEKFYRSLNSYEPAEENATYVMSFNNFVEMSKKTKTEIMSYIKEGATDLRRIYHTDTWCDRVLQVITGNTYNQEAMDRIERLINEGQLLKKN